MTDRWLEDAPDRSGKELRAALDDAPRFVPSDLRRRAVWQRVQNPTARRRLVRRAFVAGAFVSAAAAIALVPLALRLSVPAPGTTQAPHAATTSTAPAPLRTPNEARTVRLDDRAQVDLEARSEVTFDRGRPRLEGSGRFRVARASGKPYAIAVGRYVVIVVGTRFVVRQHADRVAIDVEEGAVDVHEDAHRIARLQAGQSWRSDEQPPAAAPGPRKIAPPVVRPRSKTVATGETPEQKLAIYRRTVDRDDPQAENALYEMGRIYRDELGDDREALATFERYRARYPHGRLRAEADVFIVEMLTRLHDAARALDEATRFLTQHPRSERRPEMARLAGDLLRARGDCRQAIGYYTLAAKSPSTRGDVADSSAFQVALCLRALGEPGARVALERYLRDHPEGRHALEARRLLSQ